MSTARAGASGRLRAWRGWAVALAVLLGMVVIAPVALGAGIGAAEELTGHDDVLLGEGLLETRAFVDATLGEVAADLSVSPSSDNADPAVASELHNNHSFSDQSHPLQYPGYDDCDSWKHIVLDGWTATYGVEITLRDVQDAEHILNDTRRFWESLGYDVEMVTSASAALGSALFTDGYALHVNALKRKASLVGWTDCLPPG